MLDSIQLPPVVVSLALFHLSADIVTRLRNELEVLLWKDDCSAVYWSLAIFCEEFNEIQLITETGRKYSFGGLLKLGYPQIIQLSGNFLYKASILGYPHFRKPPFGVYFSICLCLRLVVPILHTHCPPTPGITQLMVATTWRGN